MVTQSYFFRPQTSTWPVEKIWHRERPSIRPHSTDRSCVYRFSQNWRRLIQWQKGWQRVWSTQMRCIVIIVQQNNQPRLSVRCWSCFRRVSARFTTQTRIIGHQAAILSWKFESRVTSLWLEWPPFDRNGNLRFMSKFSPMYVDVTRKFTSPLHP